MMNRTVFLSLALLAATVVTDRVAVAQGFSSVSSPSPAARATTAVSATSPASSGTVLSTSASAGAASVATTATPASATLAPTTRTSPVPAAVGSLPAPKAQVASTGFASVSGGAPDLAAVVPGNPSRYAGGSNSSFESADKVLVVKHERRLYLLNHDRVVAEYPVKLGLNPYGHKQQEGDFRTPEGRYQLDRRNARSEYFLAIQLSYPNQEDEAVARENGWRPGGAIMIHGQPNVPRRAPEFYATRDWTDGCIALSNSDMVDVWLRTTIGVPIEIRP